MATRIEDADAIVKKYMNWSFVGGLIPLPVIDVAAVSSIQMKMLYDMAELYGVPFRQHLAQSFIGSSVGALVPSLATSGAMAMGIKFIPVIGSTLGILTMPTFSLAATYALGRVFIAHFEAGGTLLDFDPEKMREHFRVEFEAAHSSGRTG